MKHYIGLDAHSTTCTFAVVDSEGKLLARQKVKTTEKNLISFIKSLGGENHLTVEESTISQWIWLTLHDKVHRLIVCNPVYLAKKRGAKTDFRDALHLAQELRTNHLEEVYHDNSEWMEIRILVNGYQDMIQEIVRSKNRLKAVFRYEGIKTNESGFYKNKGKCNELKNQYGKFVAENLFDLINLLEEKKKKYRKLFEKKKKNKSIQSLMSIPGFSVIRGITVAAAVCQADRFFNKHHFWGYCMLTWYIDISDDKICGKRRKHGRKELKAAFTGAAETVLRTKTPLRRYYDDLRKKGISHTDAKVSLARKIASIALSCLKNNIRYNDKYEESLLNKK